MKLTRRIASAVAAAGIALAAHATSINGVGTAVVPGEWTSSFAAAKAYAEANKVPLFVFFASSSCGHCNAVKDAINSAEFVAWRKNRKIIMVAVDDNVQVKNFAKSAARWLQSNKTGKYPYMRIDWPAGGVDAGCNGYPYASIPGSGSTTQARIMNMIDNQIKAWINGGGDSGSGTGGDTPTPVQPSTPTVGPEWNKSRVLGGSLYTQDGVLSGRVTITAGKVNKKGQSKIKAAIMGMNGRSRSISGKYFQVDSTTKGTIAGVAGTYAFQIKGSAISGTLSIDGTVYEVKSEPTGGTLTAGTYVFALEDYPLNCQGYKVIMPEETLPHAQTFTSTATKWTFPRKASLRYDAKVGDFVLSGLNPSGLKLSYAYKTGYFKGKFTVYAQRSEKAMKRYTANVTGFMVGDEGCGIATIKNVGSYPCTIERY